MSHCRIHGVEYRYEDGCSECRDAADRTREAEERAREAEDRACEADARAEADRAAILERLSAAEYARANPGNYQCPACRYITLLRDASRCPICHANPGDQYWAAVRDAERAEALRAEAAAREWKRTEPERVAKAAAAAAAAAEERKRTESERAAKAARLASEKRRAKFWGDFWGVYAAYLLPIICVLTAVLLRGGMESFFANRGNLLLFCPVLNWLAYAGLLISRDRELAWGVLAFWVVTGVLGHWLEKSTRSS
jgi:hypothetical protein